VSQRKSHSPCKAVVGVKMKKEFMPKPRNLIYDPSDICQNGVFRVQMGSFLRCAQDSELKIGVTGVSRIPVAGSGPHWQLMAGDPLWERDVLSLSPESRDGGRRLKQGELRQSVHRDLYVWQVFSPPRHHTLEAFPLRARDWPTTCLPRGSPGPIRRVYRASLTQKA